MRADVPIPLLDISDVLGKRVVHARLRPNITLREDNVGAAFEVLSRFAVGPNWLVHLPPTISPCDASARVDYLEHPDEALRYYAEQGVERAVVQEKHRGVRAVIVCCRDEVTAMRRFGAGADELGVCYGRTGRPSPPVPELQRGLISAVRAGAEAAGLFAEMESPWLAFEAVLMPRSVAHGTDGVPGGADAIRRRLEPLGLRRRACLREAVTALEAAEQLGVEVSGILDRQSRRLDTAERYLLALRRRERLPLALDDLRLAPLQMLASEGATHFERDPEWHVAMSNRLCVAAPELFVRTMRRIVDPGDEAGGADIAAWWERLTDDGSEGVVVRPLGPTLNGRSKLIQSALKCRGRDALRLLYGPDYDEPDTLRSLKGRGLAVKRSVALREFALGVEALERFVRHESLYRVHECIVAALALEAEPLDPRL